MEHRQKLPSIISFPLACFVEALAQMKLAIVLSLNLTLLSRMSVKLRVAGPLRHQNSFRKETTEHWYYWCVYPI